MEYFVKSGAPSKQRSGCVVVGVYERRKLSEAAQALDGATGGAITQAMRRGDMDGRRDDTLLLHGLDGVLADRVLLVGLGRERDFDDKAFVRANGAAIKALRKTGATDAVS